MLSRTAPRHACETPLIQGSPPGHVWTCSCGQNWTVRHRIGEYGGHLTWDKDRAGFRLPWLRPISFRGALRDA